MKKRLCEIIIFASCMISQAALAAVCEQGAETHIWISPRVINAGEPVKVLAVSSSRIMKDLVLTHPNGAKELLKVSANSGPPWSLSAKIDSFADGNYQIAVQDRNSNLLGCRIVFNGDNAEKEPAEWNNNYESFYSAWIEELFDSYVNKNLVFPSLEPILRNSERNFLFNYLGLNEDEELPATPDCADLPYFLRTYFAWKNGLSYSFRTCNRGLTEARPSCSAATIKTDFVQNRPVSQAKFKALSRSVMDAVQSGNARTSAMDDETDFYPVALQRKTLWPGTIFADPYGHVLMLVKWVAQTPGSEGILFAVSAHPDNSVSRNRFWEGEFLFGNSGSAAPGFKAFRPIANNQVLLSNAQLPNYSTEQENLPREAFYLKMDKLINPDGLDARQAYEVLLTALVEQLETRVLAIESVENYFRQGGHTIEMPNIPNKVGAIFESIGLWEDYSTPSRDIRLLNAIKVLLEFPNKIVHHPEMFNLTAQEAQQTKIQILQLHQELTRQKKIAYIRSNGTPQQLTVADILARRVAFEMAYNPNDCPEIRWGAEQGTDEYASCSRHAPETQINQMLERRDWFHAAERPPR